MTPRPGPAAQPAAPGSAVINADGLLLDLDGVVWIDGRVLPGVAEALGVLRSRGLPLLFLTNDPRGSREQYVARLAAGGVPASPAEVLTSARAAAQLVAAREPADVLVIGSPALHAEARAAGPCLTSPDRPHTAQAVLSAATRASTTRSWPRRPAQCTEAPGCTPPARNRPFPAGTDPARPPAPSWRRWRPPSAGSRWWPGNPSPGCSLRSAGCCRPAASSPWSGTGSTPTLPARNAPVSTRSWCSPAAPAATTCPAQRCVRTWWRTHSPT